MAAQEFSSPGAHMSGSDSGSSSSGSKGEAVGRYHNDNYGSSGNSMVYYAPSVDTGSSNARDYDDYRSELYYANSYNQKLWNNQNTYNYNLYNNALSWYERMQNSSVQRMVEDMKKAGINPVLAGRYNGYSSISFPSLPYSSNVPYLDVSSLGSYDSSHYASMISYINNQDSISATSKNILMQCAKDIQVATQYNQTSKDTTKMNNDIQKAINEATIENQKYLQNLVNENKITTTEMDNQTLIFTTLMKSIASALGAFVN